MKGDKRKARFSKPTAEDIQKIVAEKARQARAEIEHGRMIAPGSERIKIQDEYIESTLILLYQNTQLVEMRDRYEEVMSKNDLSKENWESLKGYTVKWIDGDIPLRMFIRQYTLDLHKFKVNQMKVNKLKDKLHDMGFTPDDLRDIVDNGVHKK